MEFKVQEEHKPYYENIGKNGFAMTWHLNKVGKMGHQKQKQNKTKKQNKTTTIKKFQTEAFKQQLHKQNGPKASSKNKKNKTKQNKNKNNNNNNK